MLACLHVLHQALGGDLLGVESRIERGLFFFFNANADSRIVAEWVASLFVVRMQYNRVHILSALFLIEFFVVSGNVVCVSSSMCRSNKGNGKGKGNRHGPMTAAEANALLESVARQMALALWAIADGSTVTRQDADSDTSCPSASSGSDSEPLLGGIGEWPDDGCSGTEWVPVATQLVAQYGVGGGGSGGRSRSRSQSSHRRSQRRTERADLNGGRRSQSYHRRASD